MPGRGERATDLNVVFLLLLSLPWRILFLALQVTAFLGLSLPICPHEDIQSALPLHALEPPKFPELVRRKAETLFR